MAPVIRIDDQVMDWLRKRAIELGMVFETPNAVIRRVLDLDSQAVLKGEITARKEEGQMSCFLTIHQPIPRGENLDKYDNCIWINRDTPHWVREIKKGDLVFVYEVKTVEHRGFVEINGNLIPATKPRGGLVSCFKVVEFISQEQDLDIFEGNIFLAKYEGDIISRKFVPLDSIKRVWPTTFNPRIPGGIRRLHKEECKCAASLMEVTWP